MRRIRSLAQQLRRKERNSYAASEARRMTNADKEAAKSAHLLDNIPEHLPPICVERWLLENMR